MSESSDLSICFPPFSFLFRASSDQHQQQVQRIVHGGKVAEERDFVRDLMVLEGMGFNDQESNLQALIEGNGNLDDALEYLLKEKILL